MACSDSKLASESMNHFRYFGSNPWTGDRSIATSPLSGSQHLSGPSIACNMATAVKALSRKWIDKFSHTEYSKSLDSILRFCYSASL